MQLSMPRHIKRLMVATLIIMGTVGLGLGNMGPVLAADEVGNVGNGPATASGPLPGWVTIENGGKHWYAFSDGGDQNEVKVRLAQLVSNRVAFEVWTSEQLRSWQNGDTFNAVGAGTVNKNLNDDLYWTGNFVASNTYYVVVNSRNFGPVDYQLNISGDDVGFPAKADAAALGEADEGVAGDTAGDAEIVAEATTVETEDGAIQEESAALVAEAATDALADDSSDEDETAAATTESGTHAGVAWSPTGETRSISFGEIHWYSFRDEGDTNTIVAELDASPNIGVLFEIWTDQQLQEWKNGEKFDPVGAGTENSALDIDRYWAGSFVRSGNYYVVVRHSGLIGGSSQYNLTVTGDDVSYQVLWIKAHEEFRESKPILAESHSTQLICKSADARSSS